MKQHEHQERERERQTQNVPNHRARLERLRHARLPRRRVRGVEDDARHLPEPHQRDEQTPKKRVRDERQEELVVEERHAIVDEDAMVVHPQDASAARAAVVAAVRLVAAAVAAVAQPAVVRALAHQVGVREVDAAGEARFLRRRRRAPVVGDAAGVREDEDAIVDEDVEVDEVEEEEKEGAEQGRLGQNGDYRRGDGGDVREGEDDEDEDDGDEAGGAREGAGEKMEARPPASMQHLPHGPTRVDAVYHFLGGMSAASHLSLDSNKGQEGEHGQVALLLKRWQKIK